MTEPNYAGNIIINLASLPDFLRKPILKKRLMEFFPMTPEEKSEIINNALEAGPTIPFPNFSKLFKTWLEVLVTFTEEQRMELFSKYVTEILNSPQKIISFNLDGILEIFLSLKNEEQEVISNSIKSIVSRMDAENKKKLMLIIPDNAKVKLGI